MIFWVAVELMPTNKEAEENNALPTIIIQPTAVEARDDKDAALKVALKSDALKTADQDRLQVLVRPF